MGVINVLDKHVAELIAAGEVVERPSSVVKELIENSIDAGAKNITVEIKNGGTTFMRVTDDGCGILRDDIKVAFLRHATSKVKVQDDLDSISTLGFRGEALASICAVSKLRLITRNKNEEIGSLYEINGGEEISLSDTGCPVGTTFIIRDLFYNIPARAKFLKKDISEGNAVSNVVDKTALSHPDIAFTYIKDGKQALKTFGDGKLISAIYSVYGKDFKDSLIPVDYTLESIRVYGYVSKPVNARPNRNMQNFFINGRYVKTKTGFVALEEAFKGSVMVGKFPSCVLNIELPFEATDVNVHPSKIEVRFVNERPVFDAVYHAVKSALMKYDSRKSASFKHNSAFNEINGFNPFKNAQAVFNKNIGVNDKAPLPNKTTKQDDYNPFDNVSFNANDEVNNLKRSQKDKNTEGTRLSDSSNPFDIFTKTAINNNRKEKQLFTTSKPDIQQKDEQNDASDNLSLKDNTGISKFDSFDDSYKEYYGETEKLNTNSERITDNDETTVVQKLIKQDDIFIKYIGEVFNTYIIAEKNSKEILLIDKHAAHERLIYEKLKSEKAGAYSQFLLQPVTVTLDKAEYNAAVNNLDMFKECAFDVDDFGNGTVIVRSAPQYLDAGDISDCIAEMSNYIALGKNDIYSEKMDWFYHNVACRCAVKAGNKSTAQELIELVKKLEDNPELKYCPHGRPICIVLTKNEIEKQFGRV